MARIRYNKERSNRQSGVVDRLKPAIHAVVTKGKSEDSVDLSQYLPLSIVKKKMEEAAEATRQAERKRYNSGLKNINDQLNAAKQQKSIMEAKISEISAEVKRLKSQISKAPDASEGIIKLKDELSSKEREVSELKLKASEDVHSKEITIAKLESNIESKKDSDGKSEKLLHNLQKKLDELYNKIADGSIQPLVGSKISRPELEDKIFIDPIDKEKEPKLDSHIDVKEEKPKEEESNMKTDLAKLRKLLNV